MNVCVHRECTLGTTDKGWLYSFFSTQKIDPYRILLETLGGFNKTLYKSCQNVNTQFLKKNRKIDFLGGDINCGKDFVYIPLDVLNKNPKQYLTAFKCRN